jgi:hypothetical protein
MGGFVLKKVMASAAAPGLPVVLGRCCVRVLGVWCMV